MESVILFISVFNLVVSSIIMILLLYPKTVSHPAAVGRPAIFAGRTKMKQKPILNDEYKQYLKEQEQSGEIGNQPVL